MSGRTPPGPASGRGHELTDPRRPSLWIHMMRKNLGSVVAVVALVLVGAASAASSNSQPVLRPFVAGGGLAFGPSTKGDGPSTPTGVHLRCMRGRHVALSLKVRNRSAVPVTLASAALDPPTARIIRRVGVQFRIAPPLAKGDALVIGLRHWSRSASRPVVLAPGRSAWVQSSFVMQDCSLLLPHGKLIANRAMTLNFEVKGTGLSQQLAVPAARIILTR